MEGYISHKVTSGLRGNNREEKYRGSHSLRRDSELRRKNEESLHSIAQENEKIGECFSRGEFSILEVIH